MKYKWIRVHSKSPNATDKRKKRVQAKELPQFEEEYGIKVFVFAQKEDGRYSFTDEESGYRICEKDSIQEGIDFLEDKFYNHNLAERIKELTKDFSPLMELKNWSDF